MVEYRGAGLLVVVVEIVVAVEEGGAVEGQLVTNTNSTHRVPIIL